MLTRPPLRAPRASAKARPRAAPAAAPPLPPPPGAHLTQPTPTIAPTPSGPFHADDVLAWALLRAFAPWAPRLIRTRDEAEISAADVVFDVGAIYDPSQLRFDHHQKSYTGPWSSAGMVLDWLRAAGHVEERHAAFLRENIVDYVDDVDNGRREPEPGRPCFARIVEAYNRGNQTLADYDLAFHRAAEMALDLLRGLSADHAEREAARSVVIAAMQAAEQSGSNILLLQTYVRWKPAYFEAGGAEHPTDWVIHPGMDGSWRALAIPPSENSFAQKRSLPAAWAGLTDGDLEAATGVPGARFCHKNLCITVFQTFGGLMQAMSGARMLRGPVPSAAPA